MLGATAVTLQRLQGLLLSCIKYFIYWWLINFDLKADAHCPYLKQKFNIINYLL